MTLNWTLQVGHIRVDPDSVAVLYDEPHLLVIEVDLTSKYAEVLGSQHGDDEVTFILGAGEHTLKYDKDAGDRYTELHVRRPGIGNWSFMQQVTRYTWRIVGYDERYGYERLRTEALSS